jgi:uncharacterized protein YbjT (DUF2867 family)
MENSRIAIIAGASGLIGGHLLDHLLATDAYSKVISISRKPLKKENNKLEQIVIDFDELSTIEGKLKGDHVFCCLGSTIKKAGSKENFYKYDYSYSMELAVITSSNGASMFSIVSSMGANKKSRVFYNRVKGEVEESISQLEFKTIRIFRPSLLLGERKEFRFGEKIGEYFSYLLYPFFPLFKNYRPIKAEKVAKAMVELAFKEEKGVFIHLSGVLQKY